MSTRFSIRVFAFNEEYESGGEEEEDWGDNERGEANGRFGGGALDTGNQFPRREAGTIIEELGATSRDTLVNALSTSA